MVHTDPSRDQPVPRTSKRESLHQTQGSPASDPTIAVAVVVPLQAYSATGAEVAGPIVKDMLDAALLPQG
jgi:cell division protein FtsI/penicillin-binding protein 2